MKVDAIQYELEELTKLNQDLSNSEKESEIESTMLRLYYRMRELFSEPEYVDTAKEIIQKIELYHEQQLAKSEVIKKVTELIEAMQNNFEEQKKINPKKSVYEQIRTYDSKKSEEKEMSKKDIDGIVTVLRTIQNNLQVTEDFQEIEMNISRLTEIVTLMRDMEAAQTMRQYITRYYMNELDMDLFLNYLDEFIEEVECYEECEDESAVWAACKEVKNVCGAIWNVVKKETGAACKDIGKTLREETPNCTNAINYVKGTPKRAEKALKRKLRGWLLDDDQEDTKQ